MANPEHVEIVKQGAEAILHWQQDHPSDVLDLAGSDLAGALLDASLLERAQLDRADLTLAKLRSARLMLASLTKTRLLDADLSGADLHAADLTYANLIGADLSGARLTDSDLSFADLSRVNLQAADLSGAMLCGTNLSGAILNGAKMSNCFCFWTSFGDVDLSAVEGLESVEHGNPSTVGIDTLFKSKGKIPEAFLRGAGVPDVMIDHLRSLTGAALDFHTCFISFTEADDAISKRLYNDLQGVGVRCWRWKEDAKWGGTLIAEIDQAVRVYDKLVVILSKASLESQPVIREIERALQKEQREKKDVLFPIRVDDAVFSWEHALQADVLRKFVGDFREWQNPTKYDATLKRLIDDLRAEEGSKA